MTTIKGNNGHRYQCEDIPIKYYKNVSIYKGMDYRTNNPVTITIIKNDRLNDKLNYNIALEECQYFFNVIHENLSRIIDIFRIDTSQESVYQICIVNEYFDGVFLSDVLKGYINEHSNCNSVFTQKIINIYKAHPIEFAIFIVKKVLCGVMALHNKCLTAGVIDISDIIITYDKTVKIINYGLVEFEKYYHKSDDTYLYFAPEIRSRYCSFTKTSDTYSIGILFYNLLTGHLSKNDYIDKPINDIENIQIRNIVEHAVEMNPNKRYVDAGEFLKDLEKLENSYTSSSSNSFIARVSKLFTGDERKGKDSGSAKISEFFTTNNTKQESQASVEFKGERKYVVNSSDITIRFGNIIESDSEVIVSSDDSMLTMGGGVSMAILSHGGLVIQDDARKNIPVQLGDMIVSTAGSLRQKYIFHCITIDYNDSSKDASQDKGLQKYIIRRSVDKCLKMMPLLGVESIAFPAIGSGVAQFSIEEIANCMTEIITDFLYSTSKHFHIEIYLNDHFKKNGYMDYMAFFENVAKNIVKHNNDIEMDREDESQELAETSTLSLGKMAAISPDDEHMVFVSYSRKDMEIARLFCSLMDKLGISYWFDITGKFSGNNFKEILVDAIDTSKIMVFLSSVNSNNSPFVIKEISLAVAGNKKILPIRLDDSPYAKSVRFDLSDIDWIEYSEEKQAEAMEKFTYCIQLYLKSLGK